MTIMAKNPNDYGLETIQLDSPVEYDSIHLTASTNLNLIADATLQPLSQIQDLNPSLLRMVAPSGFQIHVPKGSAETAGTALESVPAANRQAWRLHHVQPGDTLQTIARTYNLPAERIVAVNRATDSLESGDVLFIPAVYHEETRGRHGRSWRTRGKIGVSAALRSNRSTAGHRSGRAATLPRVPSQVLHRKAAARTAALEGE
jgi:membrane-bound lytic murein transglycosylase D